MWRHGLIGFTLLMVSGCAPGSLGPMEGVASVISSVGSTATGYKTSQSTAELNGANAGLAQAQTAMMTAQVESMKQDHLRLARERVATTKLLNEMSRDHNDPMLGELAMWVSAGGDPDYAFKYALKRVEYDEGLERPDQSRGSQQTTASSAQTTRVLPPATPARNKVLQPLQIHPEQVTKDNPGLQLLQSGAHNQVSATGPNATGH